MRGIAQLHLRNDEIDGWSRNGKTLPVLMSVEIFLTAEFKYSDPLKLISR